MRKIILWIRSWFLQNKLRITERLVNDTELRVSKLLSRLQRKEKKLRSTRNRLESLISSLSEDLEEGLVIQKQCEEALSAQRSELKILKDITVPTLTTQHKLLLQRYDAEIAVQMRKQVAASPGIDTEV